MPSSSSRNITTKPQECASWEYQDAAYYPGGNGEIGHSPYGVASYQYQQHHLDSLQHDAEEGLGSEHLQLKLSSPFEPSSPLSSKIRRSLQRKAPALQAEWRGGQEEEEALAMAIKGRAGSDMPSRTRSQHGSDSDMPSRTRSQHGSESSRTRSQHGSGYAHLRERMDSLGSRPSLNNSRVYTTICAHMLARSPARTHAPTPVSSNREKHRAYV